MRTLASVSMPPRLEALEDRVLLAVLAAIAPPQTSSTPPPAVAPVGPTIPSPQGSSPTQQAPDSGSPDSADNYPPGSTPSSGGQGGATFVGPTVLPSSQPSSWNTNPANQTGSGSEYGNQYPTMGMPSSPQDTSPDSQGEYASSATRYLSPQDPGYIAATAGPAVREAVYATVVFPGGNHGLADGEPAPGAHELFSGQPTVAPATPLSNGPALSDRTPALVVNAAGNTPGPLLPSVAASHAALPELGAFALNPASPGLHADNGEVRNLAAVIAGVVLPTFPVSLLEPVPAPESVAAAANVLAGAVPADWSALERGAGQFFAQLEHLGQDVSAWVWLPHLAPLLAFVAIAPVTMEILRSQLRKQKPSPPE
jgi:hypothetical protein